MTALPQHVDISKELTAQKFLVGLGLYFALQVAIRVAQLDGLELDEAEQVFESQQLHLGYGSQPPLYVWLQWLAFSLLGVGHFALSLVKNALLFGLYACVFGLARMLLGTLAASAIAASLALIVPLGWEAQIDRTHSILASTLAAGALWTYVALVRKPSAARRALLGLLLGLGMQSKYNFAIFALGLATASLLVREHRRLVWVKDIWITISLAALTLLPHAVWFIQQFDEATRATLEKMSGGVRYASYGASVGDGFKNLLVSILSFITPLWLVLAGVYRSPRQGKLQWPAPEARLFLWLYAGGLACITALILGGELAHVKSRWLQPLLFSVPLACFVVFPPRSDEVYRRLLNVAVTVALAMTLLLALRPELQSALGKRSRIAQPYPELAAEVARRFPDVKTLAVDEPYVGGNLRIQPPNYPVVLLSDLCRQAPLVGDVLVLVKPGNQAAALRMLRACHGMVVARTGRIGVQSDAGRNESLLFAYALVGRVGS
jgi:4-amino-4-deoxy-L-arabinose transferase-like glycosyltransferase